jgi:hypothetical protein
MTAWDVQAGIDRNFFAPGPTAFWRGYGKVNDGLGQGSNGDGGNLGGIPANGSLKPEPLSISAPRCRSQAPRSIAGSSLSSRILHFDVFYTGGRLYF